MPARRADHAKSVSSPVAAVPLAEAADAIPVRTPDGEGERPEQLPPVLAEQLVLARNRSGGMWLRQRGEMRWRRGTASRGAGRQVADRSGHDTADSFEGLGVAEQELRRGHAVDVEEHQRIGGGRGNPRVAGCSQRKWPTVISDLHHAYVVPAQRVPHVWTAHLDDDPFVAGGLGAERSLLHGEVVEPATHDGHHCDVSHGSNPPTGAQPAPG